MIDAYNKGKASFLIKELIFSDPEKYNPLCCLPKVFRGIVEPLVEDLSPYFASFENRSPKFIKAKN